MTNQAKIKSVLEKTRWASRILSGKREDIKVHLLTFPGVVGGVFSAKVAGLIPDHFGQVDVAITCIYLNSDHSKGEFNSPSPLPIFEENESLLIHNLSFDIMFRIPYDEAKGTEEGAVWHLSIHLGNGRTEIFEIPVCRTSKSNPNMTAVRIAAEGIELEENQQKQPNKPANKNRKKSYQMATSNGVLKLRIPARTSGRVPILAKGLGMIAGMWALMLALFFWLSARDGGVSPILFVHSLILLVMVITLVFMCFGTSYCRINKKKMIIIHKLFGQPIKWRNIIRDELIGFSTMSLGPTPSAHGTQLNYLVIARTKKIETVFICLKRFDKNEARMLAKRLNDFLAVGA